MIRPAEDKFGPALAHIQRIRDHIRTEAELVRDYRAKSIENVVIHIQESLLQRRVFETALDGRFLDATLQPPIEANLCQTSRQRRFLRFSVRSRLPFSVVSNTKLTITK